MKFGTLCTYTPLIAFMFDIANSSQICQTSEPEEELPSKHISVHMNLKDLYYALSNLSFWSMPSSGHCSYFAFFTLKASCFFRDNPCILSHLPFNMGVQTVLSWV